MQDVYFWEYHSLTEGTLSPNPLWNSVQKGGENKVN